MLENEYIILSTIEKLLGKPKQSYKGIVQYEFNCPSITCKRDRNKFNWSFNSEDNIFRCWKCNYKGIIHRFVNEYGTQDDYNKINSVLPFDEQKKYVEELRKNKVIALDDHLTCELPEGYMPLTQVYKTKYYRDAIAYLKIRWKDCTEEFIKKYNVGYTEKGGARSFRIIIPSYNVDGNINYYQARTYYTWVNYPYLHPEKPGKSEIIFNVKNINFDLPVYLTEGVFDMIPLYNCIPLLGKDVSELLLSKLVAHNSKIILCLDEDAIKDSIKIYNKLSDLNLNVYFVGVKDDIAKHFEKYGKEGIVSLLKGCKKLDSNLVRQLSMRDIRSYKDKIDEKTLDKEWEELKRSFDE